MVAAEIVTACCCLFILNRPSSLTAMESDLWNLEFLEKDDMLNFPQVESSRIPAKVSDQNIWYFSRCLKVGPVIGQFSGGGCTHICTHKDMLLGMWYVLSFDSWVVVLIWFKDKRNSRDSTINLLITFLLSELRYL